MRSCGVQVDPIQRRNAKVQVQEKRNVTNQGMHVNKLRNSLHVIFY